MNALPEKQRSIDGRRFLDDVEDLLRLLHLGVARGLLGHLPSQLQNEQAALPPKITVEGTV
jgi:hypothetical protein